MAIEQFKRAYLIGAAIIWVGLILAITLTLTGTPHFGIVLTLLSGGAVWFVVIIPGVLRTVH